MKVFYLVIFLLTITLCLGKKSYRGYQVLSTAPIDELSLPKLIPLLKRPEFDFWSIPRVGQTADIMASPEHVSLLRDTLVGLGLQPTVLVPDVGVYVEKERVVIEAAKVNEKQRVGRAPAFDRFLNFDEIQAYLDEVVATYPEIASIHEIGSSYEGRLLRVLKLSNGPGKPGLFFDAVFHAREWAGPPVALYAINELTENLAANQEVLDQADFYFLPVANPDGYVYTWNTDRLWRKTRRPNEGSECIGTDPNRNFDWQWGEGGVIDPCENYFPGSAAFSESEVAAVAGFLANNTRIGLYLALHSYGSTLLHPWGGTTDRVPNYDQMVQVGQNASDAVKEIRGTTYIVQQISAGAFIYSTSTDWAYGGAGIPLSYTIELPRGGDSGFELPASEILLVANETWEALKVFAASVTLRE